MLIVRRSYVNERKWYANERKWYANERKWYVNERKWYVNAEFAPKSADLRFGVLDPLVGEARGEVYLPPTPLRPGGRHRRARWGSFKG